VLNSTGPWNCSKLFTFCQRLYCLFECKLRLIKIFSIGLLVPITQKFFGLILLTFLKHRPSLNTETYIIKNNKKIQLSSRIFTHLATQQPAKSADSKSTHPSPTLTTWSCGQRLLSGLPPPSYLDSHRYLQ
jgi:hypothetical protein